MTPQRLKAIQEKQGASKPFPKGFYAIVEARIENRKLDGTVEVSHKTYVIDGNSRIDAEAKANEFIETYGLRKAYVASVYPIR